MHHHGDEGEPQIPVAQVERRALGRGEGQGEVGAEDGGFLRCLRCWLLAWRLLLRHFAFFAIS